VRLNGERPFSWRLQAIGNQYRRSCPSRQGAPGANRKNSTKDIHVQIINDQSIFIEAAINGIRNHLFEGSLLAAIVLFFFLANWRTTLIAAIAIPVSIISTFSLMAIMNYTMNQITMLSLTLMVGVVVDDAIIVLENIYRYMEEKDCLRSRLRFAAPKRSALRCLRRPCRCWPSFYRSDSWAAWRENSWALLDSPVLAPLWFLCWYPSR